MVFPEVLRENFVNQVVRIILIHLDFFQDHTCSPTDALGMKNRVEDQVAKNIRAIGKCSSNTLMLKQMVSFPVNASMLPPMESTWRAISRADRVLVPLDTMCST